MKYNCTNIIDKKVKFNRQIFLFSFFFNGHARRVIILAVQKTVERFWISLMFLDVIFYLESTGRFRNLPKRLHTELRLAELFGQSLLGCMSSWNALSSITPLWNVPLKLWYGKSIPITKLNLGTKNRKPEETIFPSATTHVWLSLRRQTIFSWQPPHFGNWC